MQSKENYCNTISILKDAGGGGTLSISMSKSHYFIGDIKVSKKHIELCNQ